jgi:hypothetical protein
LGKHNFEAFWEKTCIFSWAFTLMNFLEISKVLKFSGKALKIGKKAFKGQRGPKLKIFMSVYTHKDSSDCKSQ